MYGIQRIWIPYSSVLTSLKKTVTHLNHHDINILIYNVYQPMVRFGYGREVDCLLSSSIANIAISMQLLWNSLLTFQFTLMPLYPAVCIFQSNFSEGSAFNVATNFEAIKSAVYIWKQLIFKSTFHSARTVCKDQLYYTSRKFLRLSEQNNAEIAIGGAQKYSEAVN